MSITEEQTIWYPGIYGGRTDAEYRQPISVLIHDDMDCLIELVQKRAQEDGQWAIDNGHVGNNEANMRKMMAFVSDPKNIVQCVAHIRREGAENERSVDWVCRELANASKHIHGSHG